MRTLFDVVKEQEKKPRLFSLFEEPKERSMHPVRAGEIMTLAMNDMLPMEDPKVLEAAAIVMRREWEKLNS